MVHGVTEDPGRVTSAAIFRELGVHGVTSRDEAQAALAQAPRVLFIPVEVLSPPLARQLKLRWRLGVRNSAHTLAKLATPFPFHPHWRLCSVSHPEYIPRVAGFFSAINATALLMNGTEGESYANPKRLTRIYHVQGASRGCCWIQHSMRCRRWKVCRTAARPPPPPAGLNPVWMVIGLCPRPSVCSSAVV
ncbi:hypothetical protein SODG_000346 [Sodalis praecaptivus]